MPLTPEQQALKQVALDATPGPWHISEPSQQLHPVRAKDCIVADVGFTGSLDKDSKNAAYLAAANPAAILALLDQLEAQEAPAALNPEPWTDEERERFRASLKLGPRCPVCTVIEPGQHFPGCSKG